jgi:hypothetical protein
MQESLVKLLSLIREYVLITGEAKARKTNSVNYTRVIQRDHSKGPNSALQEIEVPLQRGRAYHNRAESHQYPQQARHRI